MAHNRVPCDVCEGTGRERIEGERTMVCHNGCDRGYFDAEARDLDGLRARHAGVVGYLFRWYGALCLEDDNRPGLVVIVNPLTVELLR